MKDLLLHPATRQQLEHFLKAPSHALLLSGPSGSGKHTLAIQLAEAILNLPAGGFANYPYRLTIGTENDKAIGIEAVRELEHFLSLKVPSTAAFNRAVIIEDAHLLGHEAQNALLKTLEEPPESTFIILNAQDQHALLPTIRSRTQTVTLKQPERAQVEAYFGAQDVDNQSINQAYAISGGLPGLMHVLLAEDDHPLVLATERARQLLSQPIYQRLLTVDELVKQRPLAEDIVFILQQMAHISLQTATGEAAVKWRAVLTSSYQAAEALKGNAQPKLALTNLMLSF